MTIIHVGSKNQTKVDAVKNIFMGSNLFDEIEVRAADADVTEFGHPKTMAETISGAKNRAVAVFEGSNFSVGIESGLIEAPGSNTGYFEAAICAIYNGKTHAIGMSPAHEWPHEVIKLILSGLDGSQAFKQAGLTNHDKIGSANGSIYTLTDGKMNRTQQNEQAVMMALVQLENSEYY